MGAKYHSSLIGVVSNSEDEEPRKLVQDYMHPLPRAKVMDGVHVPFWK